MKQFHLYTVSVALLLLSACSSDNDELLGGDNTPSAALRIEVSASDFTHAGDANTRAIDKDNTTEFENGDRIGITVFDNDNNVLYNNIPYKYNGSTWSFDSGNGEGKTIIYYDNKVEELTYLAYFPYSADADDITSENDLKAKFSPLSDQRSKDAYRASDLLVWSKLNVSPLKELDIVFKHAYSSLSLSPSIKYTIDGDTEKTYVPLVSDVSFTIDKKPLFPYRASDGSYRIVVSPKETDARWFYGYSDKMYGGTMSSATLSANTRYTLAPVLDIGEYGLDDAQMGDFYCSAENADGTTTGYLIPYDAATLPEGTVCLGIVLKAGRDSDTDWKDDCEYKRKDGKTEMSTVNGYVLALYDANNGGSCAWGPDKTKVEHNMMNREQNTGFYGYKNTQAVISFATQESRTLKTDFPAVYWATDHTEGYESSYPAPTNSSGWFLPSAGQCKYWINNRDVLLSSVRRATGDSGYEWTNKFWSSSEHSSSPTRYAWYANLFSGNVSQDDKDSNLSVRACLAF
ncbi:fimbrillin family protein [Parabacteroides sp.]